MKTSEVDWKKYHRRIKNAWLEETEREKPKDKTKYLIGIDRIKEYNNYMNSSDWKEKRIRRMKLSNGKCDRCGLKATEIHHITYQRFKNEKMSDLMAVCHDCHKIEDYKRSILKK